MSVTCRFYGAFVSPEELGLPIASVAIGKPPPRVTPKSEFEIHIAGLDVALGYTSFAGITQERIASDNPFKCEVGRIVVL